MALTNMVARGIITGVEQQFQAVPSDATAPSDATGPSDATVPSDATAASDRAVPSHGTAAVDRSADLLVRVLEAEAPVALTDLAEASGIPKSTASRLITALERRGLVEQDGQRGRLRPGPAILRVAERGMLERNIVELAGPNLDALSDASGETINLAVPARVGVEHVAQIDSRHFLGVGQWLGREVDFHSSANGKVFLAFDRAQHDRTPLIAHTAHTITDLDRLDDELEEVRAEGCATAVDELEVGLAAMAAPVRGVHGDVIAALSISGPTIRMTPERIEELKPILISEADALSRRLAHPEQGANAA
jgi:DNA-binding IclR family transcriptional regulator